MKLLLIGITFMLPLLLFAQQGTTAAGGDIQSPTGEISFSVGQLSNASYYTTSGSLYEGIQQPYEIVVTHITPAGEKLGIKVTAYPNPVSDRLHLLFDDDPPAYCMVTCTNASGQTVFNMKVDQRLTGLGMHDLPSGYYILTVHDNNNLLSSFTIIKL